MRIISWNVNGLRAVHRKGNFDDVFKLGADIYGFQEIKADAEQLPDAVRTPDGYWSYFESSKEKKGYSGVATYTKTEPKKVEYGLGIEQFDKEGRVLATYFDDFVLLNVYFPQGGGPDERFQFKLDFYDAFLEYVEKLKKAGHSIIFFGDINVAHEEIDLANPDGNHDNPDFRPEVRAWVDEVLSRGYVDVFRHFYPTRAEAYTYWDMRTHARERNAGWRIDAFFVSADMVPKLESTKILSDIMGSDHCPIELSLR